MYLKENREGKEGEIRQFSKKFLFCFIPEGFSYEKMLSGQFFQPKPAWYISQSSTFMFYL